MNISRSFLITAVVMVFLFQTSTGMAQLKNLFECPHGIVDGATGKCPRCASLGGAFDDDCRTARAALLAKIAENRISRRVGSYDADDVAEMDCGDVKRVARAYTDWKTARQRQDDEDLANARQIDAETKTMRENDSKRRLNSWNANERQNALLSTDPRSLKDEEKTLVQQAQALEKQAAEALRQGNRATWSSLSLAAEELRRQANNAALLAIRADGEQQFKKTQDRQREQQNKNSVINSQRRDLHLQNEALADQVRELKQDREKAAASRPAEAWDQLAQTARDKAAEITEGLEFGSPLYFEAKALCDQLSEASDLFTDLGTLARKRGQASPRDVAAIQNQGVSLVRRFSGVSSAAGLASGSVGLIAPTVQELGISLIEENGRKIDGLLGHLSEPTTLGATPSHAAPAPRPLPSWLQSSPTYVHGSGGESGSNPAGFPNTSSQPSRFDSDSTAPEAGSPFDSPGPQVTGSRFDERPPQPGTGVAEESPSWLDRWNSWWSPSEKTAKSRFASTSGPPATVKDQFSKPSGSRFDR